MYTRQTARKVKELAVSAQEFWDLAMDWAAVKSWMPQDLLRLEKVILAPGSSPNEIPRTRHVYIDKSALPAEQAATLPDFAPETLLYADPKTRFLYYNIGLGVSDPDAGVGSFGMRNYLALMEIDELGPESCRVTLSARFDLPDAAPAADVRAFLEDTMYDRAMISAMAQFIIDHRS